MTFQLNLIIIIFLLQSFSIGKLLPKNKHKRKSKLHRNIRKPSITNNVRQNNPKSQDEDSEDNQKGSETTTSTTKKLLFMEKHEENESQDLYRSEEIGKISHYSKYFELKPSNISCSDHIKYMEINYSCVDNVEDIFPTDMSMFIVEKNFQKYFMRLDDDLLAYELILEQSLKIEGVVLNLLEHKIVRHRFVGIYRYEANRGTLDNLVRNEFLSLFEIYSFMLSIVEIAERTLNDRDPKNPYLSVNIFPTNLLVVPATRNKLKMVRSLPLVRREVINYFVPEFNLQNGFVDNRSSLVFVMGKVFYFLCFQQLPLNSSPEFLEHLSSSAGENENGVLIDEKIMHMMRRMLNSSPVDRPTLLEIRKMVQEVKSQFKFFLQIVGEQVSNSFNVMQSEVNVELFKTNASQNRHFADELEANNEEEELVAEAVEHQADSSVSKINSTRMFEVMINKLDESQSKRSKWGMIKDFNIEDLMDDYLREKIYQDRGHLRNQNYKDFRDKFEALAFGSKDELILSKVTENKHQFDILTELIRTEYNSLVDREKKQYEEDQHSQLLLLHSDDTVEASLLQYLLLLLLLPILILTFVVSFFFRRSQFSQWSKQDFHVPLIFRTVV